MNRIDSPETMTIASPCVHTPEAKDETEPRCRLTVLHTTYYQAPGQEPTSVECNYGDWLQTDEQPYSRRITVGPDWVPVDLGWIRDPGYVVITNEAPTFRTLPTPEERADAYARVVEVGVEVPSPPEAKTVRDMHAPPRATPTGPVIMPVWLVGPGKDLPGVLSNPGCLRVRCTHGACRITITAYPK